MARDRDYIKLINSVRWTRLRHRVLSLHPLCQRCEQRGDVRAACEVHHVRPVETGHTFREKEMLAYSEQNLMAVCHACHVEIHKAMMSHSKEEAAKRREEDARAAIKKLYGD